MFPIMIYFNSVTASDIGKERPEQKAEIKMNNKLSHTILDVNFALESEFNLKKLKYKM
jgi:hypothetical protein